MISRTSSTPVWLAASISITSIWRPSAIARHGSHTPHGSIVGPPCPSGPMQLSALAISRAVDVLPTPRTPVIRKACANRSRAMALPSVRTIASWPISSAKVCGRYLRASTRYGPAGAAGAGVSGASTPEAAKISSGSVTASVPPFRHFAGQHFIALPHVVIVGPVDDRARDRADLADDRRRRRDDLDAIPIGHDHPRFVVAPRETDRRFDRPPMPPDQEHRMVRARERPEFGEAMFIEHTVRDRVGKQDLEHFALCIAEQLDRQFGDPGLVGLHLEMTIATVLEQLRRIQSAVQIRDLQNMQIIVGIVGEPGFKEDGGIAHAPS